jgi:demethylmenaquinone methyltransferase/2-methoxy-6-polyprenyl-1,4-benzoquinol methylase
MNDYQFIAPFYDFLLGPFMRSIRRDVLRTVLELQPENVLDVACGTGEQLRLLTENRIDAVGVDMSEAMLKICRKTNPAADCLLQDATEMAFQNERFALAMISFALHETGWETAADILEEIHRVLKPCGHLLVVDYSDFQVTPFYVKQVIRMIEFLAGRRHFRNFRTYHLEGGLATLISENRFRLVDSTYRASHSIVIRLFQRIGLASLSV